MTENCYTLQDLRDWREVTPDRDSPIRLGIFGDPVEHSLSPHMQNAALRECGIAVRYARFHIREVQLAEAIPLAQQNGFIGLNFTAPHKIAAMALMDRCDELTKQIGAINTVRFERNSAIGFNTDADGFARAVREMFCVPLRNLRVLLLGAGGAGRAIAFQCAVENCARLVIANRDAEKAVQLARQARAQAIPLDRDSLRREIRNIDLLVNATTLGLNRDDQIDLDPLPARVLVFDTVYGNSTTPLVRAARSAGARVCDGHAMLLQQGAAAFEIWFGRAPPLEVMRAALERQRT